MARAGWPRKGRGAQPGGASEAWQPGKESRKAEQRGPRAQPLLSCKAVLSVPDPGGRSED